MLVLLKTMLLSTKYVQVEKAAYESEIKKKYDSRIARLLEEKSGSPGADELEALEKRRLGEEKENQAKFDTRLRQEQEHWKATVEEQRRTTEEHMAELDRDFLKRHTAIQKQQQEFEAKVASEAQQAEAQLRAQHAIAIQELWERVRREQDLRSRIEADSLSEGEKAVLMDHKAELQAEEDRHREAEAALQREHLEKEAILIAESEELRAELRRREHQMASAMLDKEREMREWHYEAVDKLREGGQAAVMEEVADLRARLAEQEAHAAEKIRSVQVVMNKAMEKEKAELRAEYEKKLAPNAGSQ